MEIPRSWVPRRHPCKFRKRYAHDGVERGHCKDLVDIIKSSVNRAVTGTCTMSGTPFLARTNETCVMLATVCGIEVSQDTYLLRGPHSGWQHAPCRKNYRNNSPPPILTL